MAVILVSGFLSINFSIRSLASSLIYFQIGPLKLQLAFLTLAVMSESSLPVKGG